MSKFALSELTNPLFNVWYLSYLINQCAPAKKKTGKKKLVTHGAIVDPIKYETHVSAGTGTLSEPHQLRPREKKPKVAPEAQRVMTQQQNCNQGSRGPC